MTSFLDLPPEIRIQIYQDLLVSIPSPPPSDHSRSQSCTHGFPTAILILNKQISAEAKPILYTKNTFKLTIGHTSLSHKPSGLFPQLASRSAASIYPHLQHIELEIKTLPGLLFMWNRKMQASLRNRVAANVRKVCAILSEAPALRTVQISWVEIVTFDDVYKVNRAEGLKSFRFILYEEDTLQIPQELISAVVQPLSLLPRSVIVVDGGLRFVNEHDESGWIPQISALFESGLDAAMVARG